MRGILATLLASLAVLYALFVLLSEDRGTPSGSGLINNSERISDVGDRLMSATIEGLPRKSRYRSDNKSAASFER